MISYRHTNLPVGVLDTESFAFTYPPEPSQELLKSIRKTGILTPLMVLPEGETMRLFDGHRRLLVAREIGLTEVPAAILPELPSQELFSLWIGAQNANRRLNPFEIARLVQEGPSAFRLPREEVLRHLKKEPGRIPPPLLPALPGILNLPERLKQEAVRRGYSAPFLVKIVETFSPDLLSEVARILDHFSLSENQADQLLTWLDEIARRDHLAFPEVLSTDPLPFLLAHPKMPSAKKRDAFLKAVYKMRFPRKAELDTAFREIRQKVEGVGNLRLLPPPNFAGDRFELRITFRDAEDLKTTLDKIGPLHGKIEALTKLV